MEGDGDRSIPCKCELCARKVLYSEASVVVLCSVADGREGLLGAVAESARGPHHIRIALRRQEASSFPLSFPLQTTAMANSPTDIVATKSDVPTTAESSDEAAGGDLTFREALQTIHEPEVSLIAKWRERRLSELF